MDEELAAVVVEALDAALKLALEALVAALPPLVVAPDTPTTRPPPHRTARADATRPTSRPRRVFPITSSRAWRVNHLAPDDHRA
jgi:hypothetical protein